MPGENSGAGGKLEDSPVRSGRRLQPGRQVRGIGLEQQRTELIVIGLGNRAHEAGFRPGHGPIATRCRPPVHPKKERAGARLTAWVSFSRYPPSLRSQAKATDRETSLFALLR